MTTIDHITDDLKRSRYVLLRSYRRDGTAVDTPIWFALRGHHLLFRTKIGLKTRRLAAHPDVELAPCDYRGRVTGPAWYRGRATILDGAEARQADRLLHRRYGWQYNVVPLIKVPGVTTVHRDLPLREKLRRARAKELWPDSTIVRIELDS